MRKLDRLAMEKYNGDKKEAIKHLMLYSTKAEINEFWHEWSEEEQRYAAMVERENPKKKRYMKDVFFWAAWLFFVPLGIIIAALDPAVIYKYGVIRGVGLIFAEIFLLLWMFRKKIKATDVIIVIIMIVLGILSLIALVLSEGIREAIIALFIYLKSR